MIKINKQFSYGEGRRAEEDGQRFYLADNDARVASVTTILSKTKDMTHLIAWKKRVGEEAAKQITTESAGLGTMMHTHLEKYILNEERPGGTNTGRIMARNMADVIIDQGLRNVDEVWGIEAPLIYDTIWAGTADLIGVHNGEPAIMDFKTTIRPKTLDRVDDYRLQLCAYAGAHNWKFGTNIKKCVVFMCSRDLEYQEFVWDLNHYDKNWEDWVARVGMYYADHVF